MYHTDHLIGVYCQDTIFSTKAQQLAQRFSLTLCKMPPDRLDPGQFLLVYSHDGLVLQATGKKAPGPVWVDFIHGANAHRRQFGGGKGQLIAKATGLKSGYRPSVLDVTAGLGQDGFVLAGLGCTVQFVERSPIAYALLNDGLERAVLSDDMQLQEIVARMSVQCADSIAYLNALAQPVELVYLDPMFPDKNKKAQVNKSMQAFHQIIGKDDDAGLLLQAALEKAIYRVVVKRPRKAPSIDEQFTHLDLPKPSLVLEGKSTRYDVYPLKKMP